MLKIVIFFAQIWLGAFKHGIQIARQNCLIITTSCLMLIPVKQKNMANRVKNVVQNLYSKQKGTFKEPESMQYLAFISRLTNYMLMPKTI
jgi:hypothetical protein